MTKKNNIRSIRFSDEIMEMIEQQPGENFTQKFEYLVTRCMFELPKKEEQIKLQDKHIQEQRETITMLHSKIGKLNNNLWRLEEQMKSFEKIIEKTIEEWKM